MTETHAHAAPALDEGGVDRKKLVLLGGVAALVLAGGGAYFLMSSGSSTDTASAPVVHGTFSAAKVNKPTAAAKSTAGKKAAKPAAVLPATSTVALGRNPFGALYVAATSSGSGTSTSSTTPSKTSSTASTSTATTPTSTVGSGTSPTSTTTTTGTPYVLQLVSVSSPKAGFAHQYAFRVAGAAKTVVANQRFGKYGEVTVLTFEVDSKNKVIGALVQVGDDNPVVFAIGDKKTVL